MNDLDQYDEIIQAHLVHERHMWLALRSLLADRPGWHFETNVGEEPSWCFTDCRLFLSVRGDLFYLWDADHDEQYLAYARTLEHLLQKLEPTHAGAITLEPSLEGEILAREAEAFLDQFQG